VIVFAFCSVCLVELVITGANQVDVLLFSNLIGEFASWLRGVVDGISFYPVSGIDD
jgi:hypothetical protein